MDNDAQQTDTVAPDTEPDGPRRFRGFIDQGCVLSDPAVCPTKWKLSPGQRRYTAEEFRLWADFIENLTSKECHPAFFNRRSSAAKSLRRMAEMEPEPCLCCCIRLNGMRFVTYVEPENFHGGWRWVRKK